MEVAVIAVVAAATVWATDFVRAVVPQLEATHANVKRVLAVLVGQGVVAAGVAADFVSVELPVVVGVAAAAVAGVVADFRK